MSFAKRAPSRALLSHFCASPVPPYLRTAASRQIRWESTEKKPAELGRSFKGQLYESTSARLEKERNERARFARERNEGAGGRNMALTFGVPPICRPIKLFMFNS
jgi:D-lactate dehydrogenase (cytochrome)